MNICSHDRPPYVEVAVDARLSDRRATLTYRVPEQYRHAIDVGQLVWVPLRKDLALGVVVEWTDPPEHDFYRIRDLRAPVEPAFRLSEIQWRLATWMAEETLCSLYRSGVADAAAGCCVSSRRVSRIAAHSGRRRAATLDGDAAQTRRATRSEPGHDRGSGTKRARFQPDDDHSSSRRKGLDPASCTRATSAREEGRCCRTCAPTRRQ